MFSILVIFLIILLFTVIYYGIPLYKKKRGLVVLPPGPRGIPIMGNLHQIAKDAPVKFSQWAEQYGKLYTIHFASKPALVVNDVALMKQLFGMTASTGKYNSTIFDIMYSGAYGVVNTEGPVWSEQREHFIKTLREAGYNKTSQIEPIILEEMEDLCEWLTSQRNSSGTVHLSKRLKMVSGNIMWSMAVGENQKTQIAELMEEWIKCLNNATNSGLAFFSWLGYIAPKLSGYDSYVLATTRIHDFVRKYFDDPRRKGDDHYDVISAYLNRVRSTTDKQSSFYGEEGFKHSFGSVVGMLLAGTETTATTMNWFIFYLVANPDVQSKVQREIDEVVGEHREPTLEDKNRMPYTQAVIEETFRMSAVIPFGIIHTLLQDATFLQYKLPKGLLLIANIYHAHNDPRVWGDPENFRPERFLKGESHLKNEDNSSMKTNLKENVVVFQPGKRTCPGEALSRDIIFLFATKLLKKFRFSPECGRNKEEYLKPDIGYVMLPQNLGVVVNTR